MTTQTKPLNVFGDVDPKALEQLKNCLTNDAAVAGALMADNHLGYSMPIGGVIAYENVVSPTGVGFDIACGNKAVRTDFSIGDGIDLKQIMRQIQKTLSFGVGRVNNTPIDHDLFDDDFWSELEGLHPGLRDIAAQQLGTVGSGNHYVDLLVDEDGYIWIANHFGSRGFGHKIATGFMNLALGNNFKDRLTETEDPILLDLTTDLGQEYWEAMQLAGRYAYAGRDYVIDQVLQILGNPEVTFEVHNHHNFAWKENGKIVVRKGATPLTLDAAFIGGSMGDISVVVRGLWEEVQDLGPERNLSIEVGDIGAIGSAPHGAGRVMSRTAAAGKLRKMWVCPNRNCDFIPERCDGPKSAYPSNHCPKCSIPLRRERMRDKTTAAIDWAAVRKNLTENGIVVLGAGADEAPGVYKDLATVLAAHSNIEILHTLLPLGVVMAGEETFDPYKD